MARFASVLPYYLAPAVLVWGAAGALASLLPLRTAGLAAIVVYAACYGPLEVAGRAWPAAPGSGWQVPSSWVSGASPRRRRWVWGIALGPGFLTRNPYAGFAFLLLAVAATAQGPGGIALAAAIGLAHGCGRAAALARDARRIATADYLQTVLRVMYWRMADGCALLAAAGLALACLARL